MKKAIWLAKRPLTLEQKEDLERVLGELEWLPSQDVVWDPTDDSAVRAEFARLRALVGCKGILAGMFPPVALSVARKGVRRNGLRLFTPVSSRKVHLRWVEL